MDLQAKVVSSAQDMEAFRRLLNSNAMHNQDLDYTKHTLVGYYDGEELIGTGGLEIYDGYALLRSLAVKLGARGMSIGSYIINDLIAHAHEKNIKGIYLLTETARGFFMIKGFRDVMKDKIPQGVKSSSEFSQSSSITATCMFLSL